MRSGKYICLVWGLLNIASIGQMFGQCPNDNTAIAGGAITPNCPGITDVPCVNGGQYALVNVVAGNNYEFSTCAATYDTQVTLYNETGGASLGYNDDSGLCGAFSTRSFISWTATYTGQLRVLIDQYPCANFGSCAPLRIICTLPVTNNDCTSAIPLTVSATCSLQLYNNIAATNSGATPTPSCGGPANGFDVWFRFTSPASGAMSIETVPGSISDGAMQLYSGECGTLVLVECDDDDGPGLAPFIERRCNRLTPNTQYFIRYWGRSSSRGTFGICIRGSDVFPTPQEDCIGGATICSNSQINNQTNYTGCTADLNSSSRGCLENNERQGTWYFFSPSANGTIGFVLTPTNAAGNPVAADYDFAIWGPLPSATCPPATPPVRCSFAFPPNAGTYLTGMAPGNADESEADDGAGVNGFVAPLNVIQDLVYLLYVDNFSTNGQSFSLSWNLSQPDLLDCTILPVDFINVQARTKGEAIVLDWSTGSERNSHHFLVERSADGNNFQPLGTLSAQGESTQVVEYKFEDRSPLNGLNYYRLKQVDRDGASKYSTVVVARFGRSAPLITPNPVDEKATLHVDIQLPQNTQLRIADARGRIVAEQRSSAGGTAIPLSLTGIQSGLYSISLYDEHGTPLGHTRFVKE
jgi:hypothetical protein